MTFDDEMYKTVNYSKIYCKANKHFKWTVNAELH